MSRIDPPESYTGNSLERSKIYGSIQGFRDLDLGFRVADNRLEGRKGEG